jgi:hypothetical protein
MPTSAPPRPATDDLQVALPSPSTEVVFRTVDEGAVLLATRDEVYFGLNEVGARIWQLLPPATTTLDELCDVLAAEYPDAPADVLRADVRELLDALVAAGLADSPR